MSLRDLSFPPSRFATFGHRPRRSWPLLPPRHSRRLQLVVSPLRAGELFVAPASLSYRDAASPASRATRLASDHSLRVEELLSYKRRTDRHVLEWRLYALAFALLCAAPYALSVALRTALLSTPSPSNKTV